MSNRRRRKLKAAAMQISRLMAAPPRPLTRFERAGWADEAQYHEFRRIRVRHQ